MAERILKYRGYVRQVLFATFRSPAFIRLIYPVLKGCGAIFHGCSAPLDKLGAVLVTKRVMVEGAVSRGVRNRSSFYVFVTSLPMDGNRPARPIWEVTFF